VVTQIRELGVTSVIVGTDDFLTRLPPAAATNVYAASPLILDSVAGPGLQWLRTYRARYPTPPPAWDAATTEAAFAVLIAAMGSGLSWTASSRTADRVRIKDGLTAISTPAAAVVTALGPIHFDQTRSATVTLTMGKVDPDVGLVSAPIQLVPYSPRAGVNIDQEVAAGHAVRHGSTILVRQQVVATGINFNELSDLDTVAGRFDADFFIWFRYAGGDEPLAVVFTNAVGEVSLGNPIRSSTSAGMSYRLYRVHGTFKVPMNFHRFPFDEQRLEVVVQNQSTPASRVVYVGDRVVLRQNPAEHLASGVDRTASINQLPSWTIRGLTFHPNTVGSTALLGDPTLTAENSGFYYAQYVAHVMIA
jgi:hypothetical protein